MSEMFCAVNGLESSRRQRDCRSREIVAPERNGGVVNISRMPRRFWQDARKLWQNARRLRCHRCHRRKSSKSKKMARPNQCEVDKSSPILFALMSRLENLPSKERK